MYKIAILGCENSHADAFLKMIIEEKLYTDIEVVGVYSYDLEAANKLNEKFGVYVAENFDEFVGKVDGIVITARNGENHYKYAKPYIESGIPMFIDKPITNTIEDAESFKAELIKNNVKVSGGSSLKHPDKVAEFKKAVAEKEFGKVYSGYARAPVNLVNDHGNFYFYSQHLVQIIGEIFGYFPNSVKAYQNGDVINCMVRYDEYDIAMTYVVKNYTYAAGISCENKVIAEIFTIDGCYQKEFDEFYKILTGGDQPQSYDEFFAPVYIINAIKDSLESGNEEIIKRGV